MRCSISLKNRTRIYTSNPRLCIPRNDESDEGEDEFEAQGDDTILTQIGRERIPNNSQDKNGIQHYAQRYVGHRNLNTDIKEACFLGGHDDMVACGSDDGRVFIYNAETGYPVSSPFFHTFFSHIPII